MKVCVVGLGLIGGSLALDLRARAFATRTLGVEINPGHRQEAQKLSLVDEILPLEPAVRQADLVVLAVPVDALVTLLPEVLKWLGPSATVTDMGSTKESTCRALAGHPKRAQFVASHPMAGTENSGPRAAHGGLFDHKTAVICDAQDSGAENADVVRSMYGALKMRIISMSAADHDMHAAYVSHLSHISSFVLANTVLAQERNVTTIFDLAGGGFESTVRLAKSSPEMWTPIFAQNHKNVLDAMDAYITHLQEFKAALQSGRTEATRALMSEANRIRRVLVSIEERKEGKL